MTERHFHPGDRVLIGAPAAAKMRGVVTRISRGEVYVQPLGLTQDEPMAIGRLSHECVSCGERSGRQSCANTERSCGHHCNHSWSHDACCWCAMTFGEVE